MIAFWPGWTNDQWFSNGANVWQWVTTMVTISGWAVAAWIYWHHRCHHCVRPGVVPVKGEAHKVCRKHAHEHGHTH